MLYLSVQYLISVIPCVPLGTYIILYYHCDKLGRARGIRSEAILMRDTTEVYFFYIYSLFESHIHLVYFDFSNNTQNCHVLSFYLNRTRTFIYFCTLSIHKSIVVIIPTIDIFVSSL